MQHCISLSRSRLRMSSVLLACLVGSHSFTIARAKEKIGTNRAEAKAAGRTFVPYFSAEVFLSHVYYLASDEIGGRGIGSPGIERAGTYIADQFAAAGILPGGENGTYFQELSIFLGSTVTDDAQLTFTGSEVTGLKKGEDFSPFPFSTGAKFYGELAFVGYGLAKPEQGYDDYQDIDVEGKVVLMFRREPPAFNVDDEYSSLATFKNKITEAKNHGAAGVLIVNQNGGTDRLMPFFGRGRSDHGLPAFHVLREVADQLLAASGHDSLDVLQAKLDAKEVTHCSSLLSGISVKGKAGIKSNKAVSRNVVGLIRGTGPAAEQYIVVGAHYDHLGKQGQSRGFFRSSSKEKQIHNGADDNASGIAGLIEIGKALALTPGLNRSVLLIAFTGEESGLLGSEHFAANPTVLIDNIVGMVNMDMIGRLKEGDEAAISVYGSGTAVEFEELLADCSQRSGLRISAVEAGSGRSDDASFYNRKIPSLHFFSGMHKDYHRPTDDTAKLNEAAAAKITHLVYDLTCHLVDSQDKPTYAHVEGFADLSEMRQPRVVIGIWPDFDDASDRPGVLIGKTVPNGPAESAGIKTGDRIIRVEGQEVASFGDYMQTVEGKKAGDVIEITVDRDGEQTSFSVKLAAG